MAAGPRDTPHGRDAAADSGVAHEPPDSPAIPGPGRSFEPLHSPDPLDSPDPLGTLGALGPDSLGPDPLDPLEALEPLDPLASAATLPPMEAGQSFRALRPQRRLRVWQLAPIIALAVGGSLMFAFPLAFESGDAGSVVAMLGLLLCCCAAGWGLMAARRVGHTWPGLPSRGSGGRVDWRFVAGYAVVIVLLAVLAVWRVARLR